MDINLMVLNVGNSRLAVGVFVAGELEYVNRLRHEQRADWRGAIETAWERIRDADSPAIAGASVNAPLIEPLEHVVEQAAGQRVEWVGREIELPIPVLTEQPERTGVDRVLNVAAA